jgi:hypothetical protein
MLNFTPPLQQRRTNDPNNQNEIFFFNSFKRDNKNFKYVVWLTKWTQNTPGTTSSFALV